MVTTNSEVVSPFDKSLKAVLTRQISTNLIIEAYKKSGVNVERFFTGVELVDIYECPLTKYRFYYPDSIIGDEEFYESLQSLHADYYLQDKTEFGLALEELDARGKVLEIGCGDGVFLQILKNAGIDGVGLEFNELALNKCLSKGLDVRKDSIENFACKNLEQFDAVVLFQVLEHVSNISSFIESALSCLRKGGRLIVAVPDNSPYYKNFRIHLTFNLPPHHMGLWNAKSLKGLEKIFDVSLESIQYDDDYSSFPKYVYFLGDLLISRFRSLYGNFFFRHLFIVLLLPFTIPVVLKMKFRSELRPHSIIATFTKT